MKVKRPLSGYYVLDVCDLCQSVLDPSPYHQRKCHCCGRELCKGCADWKYYGDGIGDEIRWVAYCAECDARLTNQGSEDMKEVVLHGLYRAMDRLRQQREAALDRFDEQARELRGQIHAMAETHGKSLGTFGV